jgi:hypothetical protein
MNILLAIFWKYSKVKFRWGKNQPRNSPDVLSLENSSNFGKKTKQKAKFLLTLAGNFSKKDESLPNPKIFGV